MLDVMKLNLKRLKQKLETEEDPLKRELLQIDIDEKTYSVANMQVSGYVIE